MILNEGKSPFGKPLSICDVLMRRSLKLSLARSRSSFCLSVGKSGLSTVRLNLLVLVPYYMSRLCLWLDGRRFLYVIAMVSGPAVTNVSFCYDTTLGALQLSEDSHVMQLCVICGRHIVCLM